MGWPTVFPEVGLELPGGVELLAEEVFVGFALFAGEPPAGVAELAFGVGAVLLAGVLFEGAPAFESPPSAAGAVAVAGLFAFDPSHPNPCPFQRKYPRPAAKISATKIKTYLAAPPR